MMSVHVVPDLMPALPELILAGMAMLLLMFGVFRGNDSTRTVSWLAVGTIAVAGFFVIVAVGGALDASVSQHEHLKVRHP